MASASRFKSAHIDASFCIEGGPCCEIVRAMRESDSARGIASGWLRFERFVRADLEDGQILGVKRPEAFVRHLQKVCLPENAK